LWGAQPAPVRTPAPARIRRYAHFAFPGHVLPLPALQHVDQVIVSLPGWAATTSVSIGGNPVGYAGWRHRDTGVELLAVIAGFQPLIVSLGQRSDDPELRVDAWALPETIASGKALRNQLATIRRALVAVQRAVGQLGGRAVRDVELLGLVKQSQERFEWWVRAEHRVEALTPFLTHRRCPACQAWSRYDARWCRGCRHEFGPRDDFARDDAKAKAEREIASLMAQGAAMRGGPPSNPPGPPPAPPSTVGL
jgi:hypothetical protein